MCQTQSATAWTTHATNGIVNVRQRRLSVGIFAMLPRVRDQFSGSAQRNAISGRPRTSSGAATSMSISCCVMCAENSTCPQACKGETRATNSASQPSAKQSASHVRIAWPFRRCRPMMKSNAVITSEMTTSGSKLQARSSSCQLCGWPSGKSKAGSTQRRKEKTKAQRRVIESSFVPSVFAFVPLCETWSPLTRIEVHCGDPLREDHQKRHHTTQHTQRRNEPDPARQIDGLPRPLNPRSSPDRDRYQYRHDRQQHREDNHRIQRDIPLRRTRVTHQNKVRLHLGRDDRRARDHQHPKPLRSCRLFILAHRRHPNRGVK